MVQWNTDLCRHSSAISNMHDDSCQQFICVTDEHWTPVSLSDPVGSKCYEQRAVAALGKFSYLIRSFYLLNMQLSALA